MTGLATARVHFVRREATIRHAASQYQKTSEAGICGRETECAAFRLINRELASAAQGSSRVRAIGRNHTLWSLLVKDLALAENQLPDDMKTHLIGLGIWAMRYSTLALLRDLPVEPLIEVNRNVLDGLMTQMQPKLSAGAADHMSGSAFLV